MKTFARFANKLYKGNPYYVPSMPLDDLNTFDKEKNGAYDFCEAEFYLAYKDNKVVGRVAAIIKLMQHGMSSRCVMAGLISLMISRFLPHCLKPFRNSVARLE